MSYQQAELEPREVGSRIWAMRLRSRLELDQLAKVLGMDLARLAALEDGEDAPTRAELVSLALGLRCSLAFLQTGAERRHA